MDDLTEAFVPFWKKIWQDYKIEVFFISISILTIISSGIVLIGNSKNNQQTGSDTKILNDGVRINSKKIFVDIAGAVENPDVFEISSGARLKDILISAGGLSAIADRVFFARNFNLARLLSDQEKIYIPSKNETTRGILVETMENQSRNIENSVNNSSLIDINSTSIEELDSLPGIGKVTAEKIIRNQPYKTIEDLLNNKIIGNTVYEKIKDLITIN